MNAGTLLDAIGGTPLLPLTGFASRGRILAKIERYNPGRNAQDRRLLAVLRHISTDIVVSGPAESVVSAAWIAATLGCAFHGAAPAATREQEALILAYGTFERGTPSGIDLETDSVGAEGRQWAQEVLAQWAGPPAQDIVVPARDRLYDGLLEELQSAWPSAQPLEAPGRSRSTMREIAQNHGLMVGPASGEVAQVARRQADQDRIVLAIFPDAAEHYFSESP